MASRRLATRLVPGTVPEFHGNYNRASGEKALVRHAAVVGRTTSTRLATCGPPHRSRKVCWANPAPVQLVAKQGMGGTPLRATPLLRVLRRLYLGLDAGKRQWTTPSNVQGVDRRVMPRGKWMQHQAGAVEEWFKQE